MGTIERVFSEKILGGLHGGCGIGHNRYATKGRSESRNKQPLFGWFRGKRFALGHNGEFVDYRSQKQACKRLGYQFKTATDTEVLVALLHLSDAPTFEEALKEVLPQLKGAFSLVILYDDTVYGIRDAFGIRPLVFGRDRNSFYVSSESCALDVLGATLLGDVLPGEVVILNTHSLQSFQWARSTHSRTCIFEYVYFSRPDSILQGIRVHKAREEMGAIAAKKTSHIPLDVVVAVPDSGVSFAMGYAKARGLPLELGLFRAHSVGRTFIEPIKQIRERLPYLKFNPIREVVRDRRVGVADDSIVRANTAPKIIKMLRNAGAREVHMIVASPRIVGTCHLGINMPTLEEIAGSSRTEAEMKDFIGADTLTYLDLEELASAIGSPKDNFCTGCMDGGTYAVPKSKKRIRREVKS